MKSRLLSPFWQHLLAVVVSIVAGLLGLAPANAEIIVDDFTQPAEVTEISTGVGTMSFKPVITEHVGELDATREIYFTASLTNPVWSFDSALSTPSMLSAELQGHTRTGSNSAIITFVSSYTFSPIDLTENGANNAFLIDFASHEGTEPPLFFRILARGSSPSESFAAFFFNLPISDTPFTTVIPFTDFTLRGGGPPAPDFSTLRLTLLTIDFFFLNPSENIQWSAELDRIRIGRIPVPEPSSVWLGMVGFLVLACARHP